MEGFKNAARWGEGEYFYMGDPGPRQQDPGGCTSPERGDRRSPLPRSRRRARSEDAIMSEKEGDLAKGSDKFVVTISFDEESAGIFRDLKKDLVGSQSELLRTALRFYSRHKALFESLDGDRIYAYTQMLSDGEHVILDVDHWIIFLKFIESHPDKEKFWEMHQRVSQSHAEEFIHKNHDIEAVFRRLEACNLFKLIRTSETDFTLILGYDVPKKFIRTEIEDIFSRMGSRAEIREGLSKIRVKILPAK